MADIAAESIDLREIFPPVSTAAWEAAIRVELGGADYDQTLIWHVEDGIDVRPYYRSEALAGVQSQTAAASGKFLFLGADAGWQIEQGGDPPADAVRADLVLEAGGTSVQQLGIALAQGVEKLAGLSDHLTVDQTACEVHFVFAVGSTFFVEIAKLRAARLLWACAVNAFRPADLSCCRMNLHVRTAARNKSSSEPQSNILRATTEAMSAVIGGCDWLLIEPSGFSEQLALDIQRILAEEAHLDAVGDAAGGSYLVEALTHSFAQHAWKLFQRIEAAGGYEQAVTSGWLTDELSKSRRLGEETS